MAKYMLTTVDNPYNPFEEFDKWYMHDTFVLGYNTCQYLARTAIVEEDFSDVEKEEAINAAIDKIIANDFLNIYRRIEEKEDFEEKLKEN